jgi:hypothetical protein
MRPIGAEREPWPEEVVLRVHGVTDGLDSKRLAHVARVEIDDRERFVGLRSERIADELGGHVMATVSVADIVAKCPESTR